MSIWKSPTGSWMLTESRAQEREKPGRRRPGNEHTVCSRLCPPEALSGNEALTPPAIRIAACWWPWPNSSPRMTFYQRKLTYPSLCTYHLHAVTDWCVIAKACPLCLSSGHFCKVITVQSFLELDDVNMKPHCQSCLLHPTPRVVSKSGHLHANLCVKVSQRTLRNIE